MELDGILVRIPWAVNPFRGDKFEEAWAGPAEAVIHYGATAWAFARSKDDPLKFEQFAMFPSKKDFDRYWYSEEIADARIKAAGYYQVPVLPTLWYVKGAGRVEQAVG